ncbi:hypothetical protein VIBNISFn27_160126 [Vibrio nigripulchritudo SFn27]|uniref:Uncharacterized protein n=1 Tax=Vibrio nigripulchritudo TaxID=28173 RepID=U4K4L2_9VIBR|nr:hypothetical protein VIBNIBLFn1_900019 [Vibrio nigripulchritudo BLFn1]CCN87643.1 hypothetical protein VIBNISFn27_160126 [Vibrio nigripulchritudo SFn27]CCN92524.1 hypothetical protein VIBNIENn2_1010125 [Vibrio nigripulchritudo ENn2]CCO39387.1 hypothetical protein VIBNISFn135_1140127 [Vibrio nigripulchritudo SFn135]CCO53385.1 hypothetical protein VIBNIWn13_500018 [Vibrio nigripulchritudo Wn13]CCO57599.1 hypothetical protein VIBNI_A1472 [Vibrio nigripulchritudo]
MSLAVSIEETNANAVLILENELRKIKHTLTKY